MLLPVRHAAAIRCRLSEHSDKIEELLPLVLTTVAVAIAHASPALT